MTTPFLLERFPPYLGHISDSHFQPKYIYFLSTAHGTSETNRVLQHPYILTVLFRSPHSLEQ